MVVFKLTRYELGSHRGREVFGIRIDKLHRSAILGHLRKQAADQRWVRRELPDARHIVQVTAREAPISLQAIFDVALDTPDASSTQILPLPQVQAHRYVGYRIFEAIIKPSGSPREISDGRDIDSGLATHQPFGAEILVGQRPHGSNAE